MQINKQTFLAGLSCILSVAILTVTIPIAFKGEKEMATIITIANGDAGSVVRGAINDNFDEVNTELETDTTAIGTLASLTTTEKSNLVGAINELQSGKTQSIYGSLGSGTGYGTFLVNAPDTVSPASGATATITLKSGSGITLESDSLKIGTAGYYLINYNICLYPSSSFTASVVILINGSIPSGQSSGSAFSLTQNERTSFSGTAILNLAANDLVKLGVTKATIPGISTEWLEYSVTIIKV